MIKLNNIDVQPGNPEIIFPVRWTYRAVVDSTVTGALEKLNRVLEKFKYSERFAVGKASSGNRYCSFYVEIEVPDREIMNLIGKELSEVEGVKFLL